MAASSKVATMRFNFVNDVGMFVYSLIAVVVCGSSKGRLLATDCFAPVMKQQSLARQQHFASDPVA
jgi:hypothetical protein